MASRTSPHKKEFQIQMDVLCSLPSSSLASLIACPLPTRMPQIVLALSLKPIGLPDFLTSLFLPIGLFSQLLCLRSLIHFEPLHRPTSCAILLSPNLVSSLVRNNCLFYSIATTDISSSHYHIVSGLQQ